MFEYEAAQLAAEEQQEKLKQAKQRDDLRNSVALQLAEVDRRKKEAALEEYRFAETQNVHFLISEHGHLIFFLCSLIFNSIS